MRFAKKGYLRTLEATIAVVLTFAFVVFMLDTPLSSTSGETEDILINLIEDEMFRNNIFEVVQDCKHKSNETIITNMTSDFLENYEFVICNNKKPVLPKKTVHVDSVYVTGNLSQSIESGEIRLYYWR